MIIKLLDDHKSEEAIYLVRVTDTYTDGWMKEGEKLYSRYGTLFGSMSIFLRKNFYYYAKFGRRKKHIH